MKHTTYIRRLLHEMGEGDEYWQIQGIVEVEKVEEGSKSGVRVQGESRVYEKQHDIYIWQGTRWEDDYYGWILFPFSGNHYLKIAYEC